MGIKKSVGKKRHPNIWQKVGVKKNHHNSWKKRGGKNEKWVEKNRILVVKKIAYIGQTCFCQRHIAKNGSYLFLWEFPLCSCLALEYWRSCLWALVWPSSKMPRNTTFLTKKIRLLPKISGYQYVYMYTLDYNIVNFE